MKTFLTDLPVFWRSGLPPPNESAPGAGRGPGNGPGLGYRYNPALTLTLDLKSEPSVMFSLFF